MRDISGVVGDVDNLRAEKNARNNPPETEPGQGSSVDWSFMDDNSGSNLDAFSGSSPNDANAMLGGGLNSSFNSAMQSNMQMNQQPQRKSSEDMIFDTLAVVFKTLFIGAKELFNGFKGGLKGSTARYYAKYGNILIKIGLIESSVGTLLILIGLVSKYVHNGIAITIGGLLTLGVGVIILCFNYDKAKKEYLEDGDSDNIGFDTDVTGGVEVEQTDDDEYSFSSWGGNSEEESEDIWGSVSWDGVDSDIDNNQEIVNPRVIDTKFDDTNLEDAISSIREIEPHTQTRQYLFEEFMKILPRITPDFSVMKQISENSDTFIIFEKILHDACELSGVKEDKYPTLLEIRENLSIIQLVITRQSGLKEDIIANEIADMYSKDEYGRIKYEGVSAIVSSVGTKLIINIFTGDNPIVSLGDIYDKVKDFMLDIKNKMPLVWGIDEYGAPIYCDVENIFSYIVSGIPRSGKSWKMVSLCLQFCMFSSPKEVTFEVFDVKGPTSDFFEMYKNLPHFKRFESNRAKIISRLRELTTVEKVRRENILHANKVKNIKDLRLKCPDVELPYLYVIIDEMLGLKEGFTKDEEREYQGLLNMLVSQLPNLGFRVLLVPHRIVNDIISKTTYTLVGCRACIKAPFEEIKTGLDVSKKDFPYTLPNVGDMALKVSNINSNRPIFCHGEAITLDVDGGLENIYRYVGAVWNKLEPEVILPTKDTSGIINESELFEGHNLSGIDSMNDLEDSNVDESFWDDIV